MKQKTIILIIAGLVLGMGVRSIHSFSPLTFSASSALAKSYGKQCTYGGECSNGLALIMCQPEVDGPVFIVRPDSREIVYSCGEMGCFDASKNRLEGKYFNTLCHPTETNP